MLWLSLRLAFQGGREALVRLIATALAVAIGVATLLAVLAQFNAFQVSGERPCWECTAAAQQGNRQEAAKSARAILWLYRKDTYKGKEIKRLDIAAVGSQAVVPPGISSVPKNGEYYASPAMAELLRTTPQGELRDRFPGKQVGTIGNAALTGPDALVIFVGRDASDIAASPRAFPVHTINAKPKAAAATNNFVRLAFGVGAAGLLFPMMILIGTATRLSAARREERYAAFRLVGATPNQINLIASVDALVAAALGAVIGIGIFLSVQPAIAGMALTGARFFANDVSPSLIGYAAILVGVPIAAAIASLLSLRRVRISPLGITRKVTPPAPKAWSVLPLLAGIVLFIGAASFAEGNNPASPIALPGFVLIMAGLIMAGPWLTVHATKWMGRITSSASSLLAVRRLTDNPRAAFRSVSGLVLAVFVGTVFSVIAPAVLAEQKTTATDAMSNVLAVGFYDTGDPECGEDDCEALHPNDGLPVRDADKLLAQLRTYEGVKVFPIYVAPIPEPDEEAGSQAPTEQEPVSGDGMPLPLLNTSMSCSDLDELKILGRCPAGVNAITVAGDFLIQNQNHSPEPVVVSTSKPVADDYTNNVLRAVLVKVDNASTLEEVRTLLARTVTSPSHEVPRTWGEIRQDAAEDAQTIQQFVFIGMVLTLIIAGCSLAVSVSGGLVERKRPFTLLRLSGVPIAALNKVVLWEAVVPLLAITLLAALIGFGLAALMITTLAPAGTPLQLPGAAYYLAVGGGLVASLLVVCATFPLLKRLTTTEDAHFE